MAADKDPGQSGAQPHRALCRPCRSGKTTTALKIAEELRRRGVNSHAVAMDNYFKIDQPQDRAPHPGGGLDFESPLCLDMELLTATLLP